MRIKPRRPSTTVTIDLQSIPYSQATNLNQTILNRLAFNFIVKKLLNPILPVLVLAVFSVKVLLPFIESDRQDRLVANSLTTAFDLLSSWRTSSYESDDDDDDRWMNGEDGLEPSFRVDKKTGLRYPPDVYPARMNPFRRENATFVALVKNDEVHGMMLSMRSVEDRINRKFGYPWVFLNNQRFTNEFKESVRSMTRSKVYFGIIPKGHWSYPDQIDITRARRTREEMESSGVPYGGSESYRHMCRYQSGFFFRHPLMMKFDYYWRVEPQVQFYCDLDYDPFLFMRENKKIYGFIISLYEYNSTVPTLWSSVLKFFESNRDLLTEDENSLGFLVRDRSKGFFESDYNLCHFWSNFEIGDLNFFRSDRYKRFFESLDQTGGFYYERWGDAPIHTIGVLSLSKNLSQIHHFDDIGYFHQPFTHCPDPKGDPLKRLKQQQEELVRKGLKFKNEASSKRVKVSKDDEGRGLKAVEGWGNGKCYCDVEESFDRDSYSCTPLWWKINGIRS